MFDIVNITLLDSFVFLNILHFCSGMQFDPFEPEQNRAQSRLLLRQDPSVYSTQYSMNPVFPPDWREQMLLPALSELWALLPTFF